MSTQLDVAGILERAGADAAAPEGSQAWALAQVGAAIAAVIESNKEYDEAESAYVQSAPHDKDAKQKAERYAAAAARRRAALANVGGAK